MDAAKRLARLLVGVAILALPVIIWWKFAAIQDWWLLRGYQPPPAVAQLASADTMTTTSRRYFYINHPKIISQASPFHQECLQSEQTVVLGCYHSGERGIAIFDVQDARLNGVEEVTAAHEMLHAAYNRLSSKDKSYIDGQLEAYYKNDLHDQRIIDNLDSYKQLEPGDLINEMHSIFGTEVANLPPALESYYQRYFSHRATVVAFTDSYEGEFTSRLNQIKQYDQQLADLKDQITTEEDSLSAQQTKIQEDRARLDSLRSSDQASEYNAAVPGFNAEVSVYNRALAKLRSDISQYNQIVENRNALAGELRSLAASLDTRLAPQGTQ